MEMPNRALLYAYILLAALLVAGCATQRELLDATDNAEKQGHKEGYEDGLKEGKFQCGSAIDQFESMKRSLEKCANEKDTLLTKNGSLTTEIQKITQELNTYKMKYNQLDNAVKSMVNDLAPCFKYQNIADNAISLDVSLLCLNNRSNSR